MSTTSSVRLKRDRNQIFDESGICDVCGALTVYTFENIINETLARQWRLNRTQRHAMSSRESMKCIFCGCSYRLRLLARALNYWLYGTGDKSLAENIQIHDSITNTAKVAEINSCGVLHEVLKSYKKLSYSEFGPDKNGEIPHQDIQALTYQSASFEVVLTSDVLEHVPDVKKALMEVHRVLKVGGAFIFTIPVVRGRKTTPRTTHKDKETVYIRQPSYHGSGEDDYLVWTEFGDDIPELFEKHGFEVIEPFISDADESDTTGVYIAIKLKNDTVTKNVRLPKQDTKDIAFSEKRMLTCLLELGHKKVLTDAHIRNLDDMLEGYKNEYNTAIEEIRRLSNTSVISRLFQRGNRH